MDGGHCAAVFALGGDERGQQCRVGETGAGQGLRVLGGCECPLWVRSDQSAKVRIAPKADIRTIPHAQSIKGQIPARTPSHLK